MLSSLLNLDYICKEAAVVRMQLCVHLPERGFFFVFFFTFGMVHLECFEVGSWRFQKLRPSTLTGTQHNNFAKPLAFPEAPPSDRNFSLFNSLGYD